MALSGNKLLNMLEDSGYTVVKVDTKKSANNPTSTANKGNTTSASSLKGGNSFTSNLLDAMADVGAPIYTQDDIAPVKKTTTTTKKKKKDEEEDDRKWFQKGAFEDGYQFGDVFKTLLGTATDVAENVGAGVIGMGEKALDAIAYVSPLLAQGQYYQNGGAYHDAQTQKMFNESFKEGKKWSADFIKKDLYDEEKIANKIVAGTDDNSVLGEKSDALLQSGGQLLATAGLQAAGVPWFLTTGATSFGSQAEAAMNDGAGYEEAGLSAAVSAGAEILTEKLSGGIKFGGNTLDDALVKNLSRKISNKVVRSLAKLGVDAVGEGAEEVVSQVISNLGTALYKEDNIGQLLASEEAIDEYIDSFIGGAALGGVSGGFNAIKSAANGVDYASGLTKNEQKVVDKVYKDRVTEAEKNGKVKEKEKSKIYDNVLSDMEQGRISTDTIEEVLGGNSYTSWKNTVDSEEAVKKELDTLNNIKKSDLTGAQEDRLNELKGKLEDIKKNSKRNDLKNQLGSEVMTMVKGDRLIESYNERSRRGQAYQADLSKYDEKQRATIQKAIDSGILNNTNRTHEFVDMIAKITADKGVLFDFTNNEKLKESGFAVDGKAVNGYVTKDGVVLNIDSAKNMNSVVGHEITHVLEGTELYQTLQNVVTEYAKSKGDYQGRYDALTKLYEGVEGADINAELTADLVGDYLFTDTDFVRNLSVQHRNVFQKIYDEIKYLYKVATAGSKEARELEKVKKAFEDAYRGATKNTVTENGVEYSLGKIEDITPSQEQRELNIQKVASMEPVYKVDADKLVPSDKSIKEIYQEYFTSWGENIHSEVFGDVAAKNSSIRSEMRHGSTPVKVASIEAIPSVIQHGEIVELIDKGNGLLRIVVAAPIDIGGTPYHMGVMLQRDSQNQRLYIHDVVVKKEAFDPSTEHLSSTGPIDESENLFLSSILDKIFNVKSNGEHQNAVKHDNVGPDIRHSLSNTNEQFAPIGSYNVYGKDIALSKDVAPVKATAPKRVAADKAAPNKKYANSWTLENKPQNGWNIVKDNVIDRGTIFETMSLKTGNKELQAKWKSIGRAESSAQWFMEHGNESTKSLKSIREEVEQSGKTKKFEDYLYHLLNVERIKTGKPVFAKVSAEQSAKTAENLERENPEFKRWADDVYSYMGELREMMVENGMISEQTRDLLMNMYPHYVPIRRSGKDVEGYSSVADTRRTGVKDPIKRATGGNKKIEPLFDTLALRTEETFKAVAKNNFGLELKNMLGTTVDSETAVGEDVIENVGDEVVKPSKGGRAPTFSVYENGERVTFDINDEMYRAMKPKGDFATYTNKALNKAGNFRRGLLTEYNPAFMLTNPIKDTQDVLINSQHPARTYANYPKAIAELWGKKGQYYREYMEHGGSDNTYFDGKEKAFVKKDTGFKKAIGFPLEKISQANNFIERVPRMAEYIASREMGRSIDVSMLDAARVTTDFSAGGDFVKTLNRNGFTFLNASVQGAVQTVRNVREAKAEGIKGWAKLAAKAMVAGLPDVILNELIWDDDEDYENLSDYVKQNYYVVGKYDDGKFVRISKGRAVAVIQNAFEQMSNLITGDDAVDLKTFGKLVLNNLAPANPMENNLIAPLAQAFRNETWYGDDLVPSRLQDIPAAEQYDETTDSISKWLGEKAGSVGIDISPYKINYVLDQYSGAIGDVFLPMLTPEAERGNDSKWADLIAPISDKFTTDSVLKNQNVTDFYSVRDELKKVANGKNATKEDLLSKVFADAVSWDMSDLYAQKREIQNSDLPDSEKYNQGRELQKKINALAEEGLNGYKDVYSNGVYAEVGGRRFNYSPEKDTWYEITPTYSDGSENRYYTQEQLFKNNLGVSYEDYWNGKFDPAKDKVKTHYAKMNGKRYNFSDEKNTWYELKPKNDDGTDNWYYQKEQEVTKGLGIGYEEYWNNREEYNYAYDHPQSYAIAKSVGGYDEYVSSYYPYLVDKDSGVYIFADKDANGDSIAYSRQKKVKAWLQELDIPEMDKLLLYKSVYNSYDDRNYEIIDYLNGRDDLTFEDRVNALRGLGFNVTDDGNISWK